MHTYTKNNNTRYPRETTNTPTLCLTYWFINDCN